MKIAIKALIALLLVLTGVVYIDRTINQIYGNKDKITVSNLFLLHIK